MKLMPLALWSVALVVGVASPLAHADFIVLDDKPVQEPVSIPVSNPAQAPGASSPGPAAVLPVKVVPVVAPVVVAPSGTVPSTSSTLSAASAPATQGRLVQVGAPMPGPAVEGWAKDVPLSLAMTQVLPAGWQLETNAVDMNLPVSWRGGRSWHAIVGELAYGHRFDARVDWVSQRVTLGPAGSLAPSMAPTPALVRKEASAPAPAVVVAPVQAAPVPVAVAAPLVWVLDPKLTLRENVEAWTAKAGWNRVVWEGADYPVVAPATFSGTFDSPTGPLATVIGAYDDSDQPLLATLHKRDKVVHVKNRGYVPTTVVPTAPAELTPSSFPNPGVGN